MIDPQKNSTLRHLGEIAHARSGDKGSSANIAVIADSCEAYDFLKKHLSEVLVADYFQAMEPETVVRFEVPNLQALNFVLTGILAGGGSRSLRVDAQGKTLGQAILQLRLPIPPNLIKMEKEVS